MKTLTVKEWIAEQVRLFVRQPNCITSEECVLHSIFAARLTEKAVELYAPANPHIPANYLELIVRGDVEEAIRAEFASVA